MGSGSWTISSFVNYCSTVRGLDASSISADGAITTSLSSQEVYKARSMNEALNPYNVIRECIDSGEHPNTIPVILALDVTGSMGEAAVEVAKDMNIVMTRLFSEVKDIEFMIMGIGDLSYDDAPIQISQFESDIRIAEQMDQVYFEYGGGGNAFESYTAAWYMGAKHTKLDCLNRGKKGIIITLGDEQINPYLPKSRLASVTGDKLQGDVETRTLYEETSQKFDIYHIDVDHRSRRDPMINKSWEEFLDADHYKSVKLNEVTDTIVDMILTSIEKANMSGETSTTSSLQLNENGEIVW